MLGKSRISKAALIIRVQDTAMVTRTNLETADSEGQATDLDIPDTAFTVTVSRESETAALGGETKDPFGTATRVAAISMDTATRAIGTNRVK